VPEREAGVSRGSWKPLKRGAGREDWRPEERQPVKTTPHSLCTFKKELCQKILLLLAHERGEGQKSAHAESRVCLICSELASGAGDDSRLATSR